MQSHPTFFGRVAFSVPKSNFKEISAVRNILHFWPWGINGGALLHYCGYILSPLQSMLKGLCHSHDPGVTRTESRTALGKLFRLTKPFAKRKGRTAETVRPSRPIASVSHNSSLWEGSFSPSFFGAGNRGRTCMVAHRFLRPARLPIPPYLQVVFGVACSKLFYTAPTPKGR